MATSDIADDLLAVSSGFFRTYVSGQLASLGLKLMKAHDRAVAQLTTAVEQARRTESLYQEELMRLQREIAAFEPAAPPPAPAPEASADRLAVPNLSPDMMRNDDAKEELMRLQREIAALEPAAPAPAPAPGALADRPAVPKLSPEVMASGAREGGCTVPERTWLQVSRRRPCEPREPVTCEGPDAHEQDAPLSPRISERPASPQRPPAAKAGTVSHKMLRQSSGGPAVAASHPPPEKRLPANDQAWQSTPQKPEAAPSGASPLAATPPAAFSPASPADSQAGAAAPGTPRPGPSPQRLSRASPPPLRAGRTTPPSTVVLVCGVGDSGADGLMHLLALHSEIRKTSRLESLMDVLCAPRAEEAGEDSMTVLIRRVLQHVEHVRRPRSEGDAFALDAMKRLERRVSRGLVMGEPPVEAAATLFDALLGVNAGGRQAVTLCSAALRGEILGLMEELYPEVKMISCVRDGRDVACSLLQDPSGPRSITEAGRLWTEGVRCSAGWAEARPRSRHLQVRYEDLARDVEGELARVLDFLDVPDQSANMVRQRARAPGPALSCQSIGLWKQLDPLSLASLLETVGCWLGRAGYGCGAKAADEAKAGVAEVVDVACKEKAGRGPRQEEVLRKDGAGKNAGRQEVPHEEASS